MSTLVQVITLIEDLISKIETIGFGSDTDEVTHNGITRASVAKSIKDNYATLQALVQGRKSFETLTDLNNYTPTADGDGHYPLAEVWKDTTELNNGLYGWDGAAWVKSEYDSVSSLAEIDTAVSGLLSVPVSGEAGVLKVIPSTLILSGREYFGAYKYAQGYLCGTDFSPQVVSGVMVVNAERYADTSYIVVRVLERETNKGDYIPSDSDKVLSTVKVDSLTEKTIVSVDPFQARAGYTYFVEVSGFDSADSPEFVGARVRSPSGSNQNQIGYVDKGAGWVPETDDYSFCASLMFNKQPESSQSLAISTFIENAKELKSHVSIFPTPAGQKLAVEGDSLTDQTTEDTSVNLLKSLFSLLDANVLHGSTGGDRTDEILADMQSRDGEWNTVLNFVQGSTNDAGLSYAVTKSNIDQMLSLLTGNWIFSPAITNGGYKSEKQSKLFQALRSEHGSKILDWQTTFDRFGYGEDGLSAVTVDNLHGNVFGNEMLGYEMAMVLHAVEMGGIYAHDEFITIPDDMADGSVLSNGLTVGSVASAYMMDESSSIGVTSTGSIVKKKNLVTQEEVRVCYIGSNGKTHIARKLLLPSIGDSNDCSNWVSLTGSVLQQLFVFNDVGVQPTTRKYSLYVALKHNGVAEGTIIDGLSIDAEGRIRFGVRDINNTLILGNYMDIPERPAQPSGVFISYDADSGRFVYSYNEASEEISVSTSDIDLPTVILGATNFNFLKDVDIARIVCFDEFIDFGLQAEREKFYDSTTFEPKPATASVNGYTPYIDIFGKSGDWLTGRNRGTAEVYSRAPLRIDLLGIQDA